MNIIRPEYFFNYLIADSDISLEANNTYLDESGNLKHKFAMRLTYNEDDFITNMINTHNTDEDANEEAFGAFSYLGTNIDDSSQFPVYSEVFKLEIYAYEKYRNDFIDMMEDFAVGVNKFKYEEVIDETNHTIFYILGQNSTPYYGAKEDINGAEMFKVSLTIIANVYESVILSNNIKLYYTSDNIIGEEEIQYTSLTIKRDIEAQVDNKASYDRSYMPNKSDLTLGIGVFYTNSEFTKELMKATLDETKLEQTFGIIFHDLTTDTRAYWNMLPISINPSISYGTPIIMTATFKKTGG